MDTPLTWLMLAVARRETFGAASTLSAAAAAPTTAPNTVTGWFQRLVYIPIHTAAEGWIDSDLGEKVDGFIDVRLGDVIGNGAPGTAADPNGGAGASLLGDGGAGWDSTEAGVPGGNGGKAGLFGTGGAGGAGGAGAAGGSGGAGGKVMGIGGAGGAGGAGAAGGAGGPGGAGGAGIGWAFGVGGHGGDGGDGSDGGRGGDGGDGAKLLGSGGAGGAAGNGGVGGSPTGLPALGGAGGTAGWLGSHGAVGRSGELVNDSSGAAAQPADGSVAPLSITGTWMTNRDGQVVIMHGLNEVYKVAPYEPSASGFNADDAAFLAANGFNVVRLGVIWAAVEPEPGVIDTAYLDSIQQTVQTLSDYGIYTIIDMHQDLYSSTLGGEGAPAWAVQTGGAPNVNEGFPGSYYSNPAEKQAWDAFWGNAEAPNGLGLEDNYAQTWEAVASAFNGNPDVIGFDIMNEPFPGSGWLAAELGGSFFGDQQLTPMYNQVDAAIRAVDPTTPVFFEPANPAVSEVGSILGLPVRLGTVNDPNGVLAFHDYCGTSGAICKFISNALAAQAQKYAAKHNIPAFEDEFGATSDTSQLTDEIQAGDKYQMSWTEWAYTGQGDITTSASALSSEALVYNPELPPVGDNVNTTTLATLAAPYPQVISGTPNSWSFANGTFQFSYSTEKADGSGSFPAGSQTIISVPTVEFPNGYQVSVTGGQVVSAPNAPQLVIASDAGATTIDVDVSTTAAGAGAG
ncbi:MAG TPA: cellulase family glycosylhydrolase [Mycobacterium sp.]|nr:cellulase family glycosylhydrolase [Mycobacterium sp.]